MFHRALPLTRFIGPAGGLDLFDRYLMSRSARRLPVRLVAAAVVVALVAAALVLVSGLGGQTLATVERRVSEQWRPAYDLLIVPPGTDVGMQVEGQPVTQANFMSTLDHGITVEQWRSILELDDVEVAAPISVIGYFNRGLSILHLKGLEPGVHRFEREVTWDNGLDARVQARTTGQQVPSGGSCGDDAPRLMLEPPTDYDDPEIRRLHELDVLVSGLALNFTDYVQDSSAVWDCLGLDPSGVYTVFGIDPEQESRLVGLDEALTDGRMLDSSQGFGDSRIEYMCDSRMVEDAEEEPMEQACEPVSSVPMLINDHEWISSPFAYGVNRVDIDITGHGSLFEMADEAHQSCAEELQESYVGRLPSFDSPLDCVDPSLQEQLVSSEGEAVIDTVLPEPPASTGHIAAYKDGRWETEPAEETLQAPFVSRVSSVDYEVVDGVPGGSWLGGVRAVPTGSYGPEPTFRRQQSTPTNPFLMFDVVGSYDAAAVTESLSADDGSVWLPEHTYQPPVAVARFDDDLQPVEGASLRPTGNPLGYLLEPPQALTTLPAAAELLDTDAPISAIRVRLAGVEDASQAAWSRVENTARLIRDATGLDAVVTLGAAPTRMLVQVPGMRVRQMDDQTEMWAPPADPLDGEVIAPGPARDVEGFGWVEEPWLIQGAAVSYLRAGAGQHVWLFALLTVTAVTYLTAMFTSLGLAQVKQMAVRRAVGWTSARVLGRQLAVAAGCGVAGGVAGAVVGLAVAGWLGLVVEPVVVAVAVPGAVVLACAGAAVPAWRSSRLPLAAGLAGGETALSAAGGGRGRRRGPAAAHRRRSGRFAVTGGRVRGLVLAMAVVELWRLRLRTCLAVTSGVIAISAIWLLITVQTQFAGTLQLTVTGQSILVDTGPTQALITVGIALVAVALFVELLWQSVHDRRAQIGVLRAIGWRRARIAGLTISQGAVLGAAAAACGIAVTFAVTGWLLHTTAPAAIWLTVIVGPAIGAAAAAAPTWHSTHTPPTALISR